MLASLQDVVNMHVEAMSDSDYKKRCAFQAVCSLPCCSSLCYVQFRSHMSQSEGTSLASKHVAGLLWLDPRVVCGSRLKKPCFQGNFVDELKVYT